MRKWSNHLHFKDQARLLLPSEYQRSTSRSAQKQQILSGGFRPLTTMNKSCTNKDTR